MARTQRGRDVMGQTFSRLTVVGRSLTRGSAGYWRCQCVCGSVMETTTQKLRLGHTRSCGCLQRELATRPRPEFVKDRCGQRYGRWTAVRCVGRDRGEAVWLCRCDCGKEASVRGSTLSTGGSKSCGCLSREKAVLASRLNFAERWALNTLPVGRSNAYGIYRAYKAGATRRGLAFQLLFDVFLTLTSSACAYCGAPPSRISTRARSNGPWIYNGIDRVDNALGYVDGNMVPCCTRCNSAKQSSTLPDFLDWIQRIYTRRIQQSHAQQAS